jgi:hypothetical protein
MTKNFITSVADVYGYDDTTGELLLQGKTLLDSSITTTLSSTDIRGGKGNQLLYKYYHTGAMAVKITDTQWNLGFIAGTVGATIAQNTSIYAEETVAFTANVGDVLGTPLTVSGGLFGWATMDDGVTAQGTFVSKTLTLSGVSPAYTGNACVRYYANNAAARYIKIPANIIPKTMRLVLDAQLVSSEASTNVVGKVQVIIPNASLTGAFTISMTSGGVSTTPLEATALVSDELATGSCSDVPVYAQITEILNSVNWYDNVYALAISGGDFGITAGTSPHTLAVYALVPGAAPFVPAAADLTFASGTTTTATIGTNTGVVTRVGNGTSLLRVYITSKSTVEDSCVVTAT